MKKFKIKFLPTKPLRSDGGYKTFVGAAALGLAAINGTPTAGAEEPFIGGGTEAPVTTTGEQQPFIGGGTEAPTTSPCVGAEWVCALGVPTFGPIAAPAPAGSVTPSSLGELLGAAPAESVLMGELHEFVRSGGAPGYAVNQQGQIIDPEGRVLPLGGGQ